jgi:RNA recognition motif-containing protein
MTNVFIGNLASNRTPDELRELFQAYGLVTARGFAFVEMRNDLNARRAIKHLDGVVLWGKPIQVQAYLPKLAA